MVFPLVKSELPGSLVPPTRERAVIVGSYNTAVLKPRSTGELQTWLAGHGYQALDARGIVVVDEVIRSGWCFVASELRKVAGGTGEMLSPHPLAITFPTPEPVYPLRLTALASDRRSLRLLVFAEHTCHIDGLEAFCGDVLSKTEMQGKTCYKNREETIGNPLLVEEGWDRYVFTALSGQLDAGSMTNDLRIVLDKAADREFQKLVFSFSAAVFTAFYPPALWACYLLAVIVLVSWKRFIGRRKMPPKLGLQSVLPMDKGAVQPVDEKPTLNPDASREWKSASPVYRMLEDLFKAETTYRKSRGGGFGTFGDLQAAGLIPRYFRKISLKDYRLFQEVHVSTFAFKAVHRSGLAEMGRFVTQEGLIYELDGTVTGKLPPE